MQMIWYFWDVQWNILEKQYKIGLIINVAKTKYMTNIKKKRNELEETEINDQG